MPITGVRRSSARPARVDEIAVRRGCWHGFATRRQLVRREWAGACVLLLVFDRRELRDLVLQQVIDDAGLRLAFARLHPPVFQTLAHQLGDVARDDLQSPRVRVLRQRVLDVVRVLVAILFALGERLADDVLQLRFDLGVLRLDRRDLRVADQLDGLVVGLAVEQALPGQELVEQDADREDVGAVVDLLAACASGDR